MADEADLANDRAMEDTQRALDSARRAAALIPSGTAGDCDFCGEWTSRLVDGACAPCRDARRLP